MDIKFFLIGMLSSFASGLIVSTINFLTNRALYYRSLRRKLDKENLND